MSDNVELSQEEIALDIHGAGVDWYLQRLVTMANRAGLELGITLHTSSGAVSGTLIGGKKYFETFASDIASNWPSDNKELIREAFAKNGECYDEPYTEDERPPQYIHLMNAKLLTGSAAIPSNTGVLWRGKISSVTGFHLGLLSQD